MSFVDTRVIHRRMDQKDARMVKKLKAKVRKSSTETQAKGAKIGEAADVQPSATSNRNEQPLEEVPTLAIPNLTATPPVRKDNKVYPCSVYIAAPYPQREQAIALMHQLEADGFTVTSTWLREPDSMADNYARLDLADVAKADCLLAFNPAGWENQGTGGRHVEYGYALALGKAIVLHGERSHIFHHLNTVVEVGYQSVSGAIRSAVAMRAANRVELALSEVASEFVRAELKHKPMNSPHEGWAVILEEVDELKEHVWHDTGRSPEAGKEAIQVAAMGLRYFANLIANTEGGE